MLCAPLSTLLTKCSYSNATLMPLNKYCTVRYNRQFRTFTKYLSICTIDIKERRYPHWCVTNIAKMIIVHRGAFSFNNTISLKHLNSWYICIMHTRNIFPREGTEQPLCASNHTQRFQIKRIRVGNMNRRQVKGLFETIEQLRQHELAWPRVDKQKYHANGSYELNE